MFPEEIWGIILGFASNLPRYSHVCKLFINVSKFVYIQYLKRMNEKYPLWKNTHHSILSDPSGYKPDMAALCRYHLNLAALEGDWDSFLVMAKKDPKVALHLCHLFMRWDLIKCILYRIPFDPTDLDTARPYLYYLWHIGHPKRKPYTRSTILAIKSDNLPVQLFHRTGGEHATTGWIGYVHPDMKEYIIQDEVLTLNIKKSSSYGNSGFLDLIIGYNYYKILMKSKYRETIHDKAIAATNKYPYCTYQRWIANMILSDKSLYVGTETELRDLSLPLVTRGMIEAVIKILKESGNELSFLKDALSYPLLAIYSIEVWGDRFLSQEHTPLIQDAIQRALDGVHK